MLSLINLNIPYFKSLINLETSSLYGIKAMDLNTFNKTEYDNKSVFFFLAITTFN